MLNHRPELKILPFCLLVILLLSGSQASAGQKFTWLTFGQAPAYINDGSYKDQGFIDQTIQMIHERALTEYEPQFFQVNHKRFNLMARKKGNCYVGWKTFSDLRLFSKPLCIWYPSGIIIHKRDQDKFGPKGTILSLEELLKNKALRLGVIDEFAYSPEVQSLLSEYQNAGHIHFIRTGTMQVDLKMLTGRRIHYTIGWPSQPIVQEKLNNTPNDFLFYNIREDQKYLYVGVSCSNGEKGKRIIERVNTLFSEKKALQEVKSYIEQWVFLSEQHRSLYEKTIFQEENHPKVVHMQYP